MENWKTKTIVIGGLIGAAAGIIAALLLIQRAEETPQMPRFTAGDGVKVGVAVLGLHRLTYAIAGSKK